MPRATPRCPTPSEPSLAISVVIIMCVMCHLRTNELFGGHTHTVTSRHCLEDMRSKHTIKATPSASRVQHREQRKKRTLIFLFRCVTPPKLVALFYCTSTYILDLASLPISSDSAALSLTAHHMSGTLSVVGNNGIDFEYWFDQLIDHNNPSAGTFKQRYFFSDQYWTGNGAPIVLQTAGETSADGWWAQMQLGHLQNKIMGELGAAGVVLER